MNKSLTSMLSPTSIISLFLRAHAYQPGQTPRTFYLWSIMTALAAMVRDKFGLYKFSGTPILPNLYTFLVAPSGVGKGTAINSACDYLRPYKEYLRMFVGRVNHASWIKLVTTPRVPHPLDTGADPLKITTPGFLVSEELGFSLPEGKLGGEFLKLMTNAYTQTGRDFDEITISSGYHRMENPCFNWLAGSTDTWLLESLGMNNILSGFASRTIWVIEDYDLSKMIAWPISPPDFDALQDEIVRRIDLLMLEPGGVLILQPGARFVIDRWWATWQQRALDLNDRVLSPLFARGFDLALKLGMLLRIADFDPNDPYRYAIRDTEITQATAWVESLMLIHYPRLLKIAYKSKDVDVEHTDDVAEIIMKFAPGECTRPVLMKRAHNKGLTSKVVDVALRALMEQKKVEMVPGPGGKAGYYWWCEKVRKVD